VANASYDADYDFMEDAGDLTRNSEWLPVSDHELVRTSGFSFTRTDKQRKGYAYSEVWIPVKLKEGNLSR